MGSENHVVVDVSSDEEDIDRDYLNWLNKDKSDSTDVVEVKGSVRSQLNSSTQAALEDDDDDKDCVILDCDPDKTTAAAVEAEAEADDDDEVLVVGQKGEIACRDFPHPRHSCAKYSFNSTSHESYCDMCHCYVCDIPAPCPYWCVALSGVDHCHANDKDKTWMNQREYLRLGGNMPTTLVPAAHATVSPSQSIIPLSQKGQNPSPRNNKIEIQACSSSASTRVANLSNVRGKSRSLSSSVSIQKDTSTYMGNLRRSRVASSGTRSYGNNVKVGHYTNAKVSRSTHRSNTSVVSPTINPEMYTQQQQQNCQLNVTDYCCAAVTTGSQSNADLFTLPEWGSTVQQQPGTNENVLQTKLSEVESWLMDSCNQAGLKASFRMYCRDFQQIDLIVCFSEDAKPTAEEGREGFVVY
ncbi:RPM1 interacting protein 13 [Raphanus sativus]|nr:RPM1 interacting protein 13 [Raphanus sativus]